MVLVFLHVLLLLCSSNVFLYFSSFYELIWDLSYVTRLTKCGLPFLINSVCCCTIVRRARHTARNQIHSSFYAVGALLSLCWKYYHSNNWKGNCRKSCTTASSILSSFSWIERIHESGQDICCCSVNLFIHKDKTRNEMTSFWFAAAARDSYIWLKPGLIYEKVNLLIVERLRRRFHQVKIIFLLRWREDKRRRSLIEKPRVHLPAYMSNIFPYADHRLLESSQQAFMRVF